MNATNPTLSFLGVPRMQEPSETQRGGQGQCGDSSLPERLSFWKVSLLPVPFQCSKHQLAIAASPRTFPHEFP